MAWVRCFFAVLVMAATNLNVFAYATLTRPWGGEWHLVFLIGGLVCGAISVGILAYAGSEKEVS